MKRTRIKRSYDQEVQRHKIHNLYSTSIPVIVVSLVVPWILIFVSQGTKVSLTAAIWGSAIALFNSLRLINSYIFHKKYKKTEFDPTHWEKRHVFFAFLVAGCWTFVSPILLGDHLSLVQTKIVFAFLVGMTSGGAFSNALAKLATYSWVLFPTSGFIYHTVLTTEGESLVFFLVAIFFFMYLTIKMCKNYHDEIMENLYLLKEKEALLEDAAEKYKLEKELEEERIKNIQSSKMAAIGEMAAGMAHEINNPLSIIVGQATLISGKIERDRIEKEDLLNRVGKISNTAERIAKIIKSLKNLARDSHDDPFLETPIISIIEDAKEITAERVKMGLVKLLIENYPEHLHITCRVGEVSQVLINLITNAVDEMGGSEEEDRWIKVIVEDNAEHTALRVVDSGTGIPANIVEHIFNPFYTTKEVGKGTGLGLSLSSSIMENHNGELKYELYEGHTSFVMRFPKTIALESAS